MFSVSNQYGFYSNCVQGIDIIYPALFLNPYTDTCYIREDLPEHLVHVCYYEVSLYLYFYLLMASQK